MGCMTFQKRVKLSEFDGQNQGKGEKVKNEDSVFVLETKKKKVEKKVEEVTEKKVEKTEVTEKKVEKTQSKKVDLDVSDFFNSRTQKEAQEDRFNNKDKNNKSTGMGQKRGGKKFSGPKRTGPRKTGPPKTDNEETITTTIN